MQYGDKARTVGCWVSIPPWLKPLEFLWTMKLSFILKAWHQMREEGPGHDCPPLLELFTYYVRESPWTSQREWGMQRSQVRVMCQTFMLLLLFSFWPSPLPNLLFSPSFTRPTISGLFHPPPFSSFLPDFSPATLAWLWVSVAHLDRFCINKAAAKDFEWEHLCMFPWTWMGSNQNNVTIIRNDR